MGISLNKHYKLQGCDISKYQGKVDFFKMKKTGVKFVIIRAGYGTTEDPYFKSYIDGAVKAGIMIGVYWFIYARTDKDILDNVRKLLAVINPYRDVIQCNVWADWEYHSDDKAPGLSVDTRTRFVNLFLNEVEKNGYSAGIYVNQDYLKRRLFKKELIASYPMWYAFYNPNLFSSYGNLGKDGHPYIWQYTSKGCGPDYGVSSKDIDLDYGFFKYTNNSPSSNLKPAVIKKGDPQQFNQIIFNLKTALNSDFRLKLNENDATIDSLLINHLSNVGISTTSYKFAPKTTFVLQQLFAWWGYDISVDGIFGPKTNSVMTTFMKQSNITISNYTTPEFWVKLLGYTSNKS